MRGGAPEASPPNAPAPGRIADACTLVNLVVLAIGCLQLLGIFAVSVFGDALDSDGPRTSRRERGVAACAYGVPVLAGCVLLIIATSHNRSGPGDRGERVARGMKIGAAGGLVGSLPTLGSGLWRLTEWARGTWSPAVSSGLAGEWLFLGICLAPFPLALAANGFGWLVYGRALREGPPNGAGSAAPEEAPPTPPAAESGPS
ncbi:MAG: hypothetical protein L0216_19790 [Planctomycetales bacterium]|nr:hypothetical protein [Planctomycetales bacterium]